MGFWQDILNLFEQFVFSESMWRSIGAIGVIILALLLRQIFVKVIVSFFKRFTSKTKSNIDDHLLEVVEKPARLAFIILGVYLAGQIMDFSPNVQLFIGRFTRSLILFTLFWASYRAANFFSIYFKNFTEKTETKFDDMLASFLANALKATIMIIGSITIIQVWFDEIAGILTGLGLGGLAFALAAQETAANLFGSITIMIDRPFEIGDWIQTPQVEGTVEEMGFRSTKVRTFAQALVTVPNSVISKNPITNWSK
ncbi:MAG: mechanosensitive ion channel family protein, partial [Peptococcales bacterium]